MQRWTALVDVSTTYRLELGYICAGHTLLSRRPGTSSSYFFHLKEFCPSKASNRPSSANRSNPSMEIDHWRFAPHRKTLPSYSYGSERPVVETPCESNPPR